MEIPTGHRGTNRSLLHEWYLDIPTEAVVTRTFDIPAETNFERIELDVSSLTYYKKIVSPYFEWNYNSVYAKFTKKEDYPEISF